MKRPIRLARRAVLSFIAVASVLSGLGAILTALEWGASEQMAFPMALMLSLTVMPALCVLAVGADRAAARSARR
jgi:hypothetical protein